MFRGVVLFACQDVPALSTLRTRFTNGNIENRIIDRNTNRERNLPSILRDVSTRHGRLIGVIDYYFQARVSRQIEYSDIYNTNVFILSPTEQVLAILGKSTDAANVKNSITKMIDSSQSSVQYFTNFEIPPTPMEEIALRVRNSHDSNWCDRPRFSHTAQRYQGHVFHDYSNGENECVLETAEYHDEFGNATGFSPIIKYYSCEMLDAEISTRPKTMRFKHEGMISTSQAYNLEHWDHFLFDLVIPIVRGS